MDEFARLHVPPVVVGSVARVGIVGATTARLAAARPMFQKSARTEVIDGVDAVANSTDPRVRLLDDIF